MKNLLSIIAAILLTASYSFAQTNGLKKAELPIVYLPDSLSVHFISPEPIQYVDISSKNIIGDLPVKNVLRIRYRDTVKSRDAIVTIAGEKFIAQYHVQWSPSANALVKSEIEINPAETRPLDIGISLSQPELQKFAAELFCKHPEANLEHAVAYGLKARLNHIYTLGDYIFLDVSYYNRTKLRYDIDEFRFKIDDNHQQSLLVNYFHFWCIFSSFLLYLIKIYTMSLKKHILFPKQQALLEAFGENLKLARKRRKLTMQEVAERAAIDRGTLREVENGNPGVSFGAYVNVLRVYGLQDDLLKLAADDELGRRLQDLEIL